MQKIISKTETKIKNRLKSDFCKYIVKSNKDFMQGFKKWIFHKGMLFDSSEKWWGDKGKRPAGHEGIDLCQFEKNYGKIEQLNKNIKVPASFSGRIIKIEKDFLGKSVFIKHNNINSKGQNLYTLYGHIEPLASLKTGIKIEKSQIIGAVSDLSSKILPHIHISFAWISESLNPEELTWNNLRKNELINLIDPFLII
jgi:hypothetical protein